MIRIITDSTCEAPAELLAHPAVTVVPLTVVFGQTVLRDGVDITRDQFWERLPNSNPLPSTSQATPADFSAWFRRFTEAGDEIIALVISHKLSGTYDSAIAALEGMPGGAIDVVDSMSISVGLGFMLQQAVHMIDAGATRAQIVARLLAIRDNIRLLFSLDTLEYLQRGGRIGKAQALVGTLLRLKPILGIEDGEVVPVARVRSRRKALESMLDLLADSISARGPGVQLAVTHAGVARQAHEIGRALSARFESPNVFVSTLGPAVGTHVGPGTIGAAVLAGD